MSWMVYEMTVPPFWAGSLPIRPNTTAVADLALPRYKASRAVIYPFPCRARKAVPMAGFLEFLASLVVLVAATAGGQLLLLAMLLFAADLALLGLLLAERRETQLCRRSFPAENNPGRGRRVD